MIAKAPDQPKFLVGQNASRPGLVRFAVSSGQPGYDITPRLARELAHDLLLTAANAERETPTPSEKFG